MNRHLIRACSANAMSALLTAVIQENQEIAVHILNYGTDPVHIPVSFPLLEVREW